MSAALTDGRRQRAPTLALAALALFAACATAMHLGLTAGADHSLLHLAQQWRAAHPAVAPAMQQFSSLGGTPVLTLFMLLATGYLCSVGRPARAAALATAMVSGVLAQDALKAAFGRARPDPAFAALVQEGLSFPSGHASMSAVFYLSVGVLVAQRHDAGHVRACIVAMAVFIVLLVGISRVLLGLHWASDVLAGWALGAGWAALWFGMAAQLRGLRGRG